MWIDSVARINDKDFAHAVAAGETQLGDENAVTCVYAGDEVTEQNVLDFLRRDEKKEKNVFRRWIPVSCYLYVV